MRGVSAAIRRRTPAGDAGSAVVEFVGLGMLLLLPVVYLVLCLGRLQAAAFAAEGAAHEAARIMATSAEPEEAVRTSQEAVGMVLADQGFGDQAGADALRVACPSTPCGGADQPVTAEVTVEVVLPGVPAFVDGMVPTHVPVVARSTGVTERFAP